MSRCAPPANHITSENRRLSARCRAPRPRLWPLELLSTVGCAVLCAGGCASTPEPTPAPDNPASIEAVLGPRTGVDVRVVAVRDVGARLAAALAPFESGTAAPALSAEASSDWARSGLRLVVMPEAEALALAESLMTTGPALAQARAQGTHTPVIAGARQQTILQGPLWSEVVRGPTLPRRTTGLHDARVQIGPGPLRLLGRCWVVPGTMGGAQAEAAIRVQLVPQAFEGRTRPAAPGDLEPSGAPLAQDQGLTFWRLRGELTLARGQAAVIVGEAPGTSWLSAARVSETEPAAPSPPVRPATPAPGRVVRAPDAPAGAIEPTPAPPDRTDAFGPDGALPGDGGPWSGVVRTVGEEMLCLPDDRDEARTGRGETRMIVIIVARPPETFTLIAPPTAPAPQPTPPPVSTSPPGP